MNKLHIMEHFTIYQEDETYNGFPSIVKNKDNSYFLGFRQAPDWSKTYPMKGNHNHVDAAAKLVYLTSPDGITWSSKARTLYNHFFCGLQDVSVTSLQDGTLIATFFMYKLLEKEDVADPSTIQFYINKEYVHRLKGLYTIRSVDGGMTWDEPIPFPLTGVAQHGSCLQMADGSLLTAIYGVGGKIRPRDKVIIMRSEDLGRTWVEHGLVQDHDGYQLLEPNLHQTPSGKLVCFMRTHNEQKVPKHPLYTSESTDGGKTWSRPIQRGIGTPNVYHLLQLKSGNVLVTYGYRYEPFGIRAVMLDAECNQLEEMKEIVLRDDGGGYDVGYPSAIQLDDERILITYYYTETESGPWQIAGTICQEVE